MQTESKNITMQKLSKLEPLLYADKICAGDVLLTLGAKPRSKVISHFSKGEYSHAAIFLPMPNSSETMLIESDGVGVGFTDLKPILLTLSPNLRVVYSIPDAPKAYMLLRHPDFKNIKKDKLLNATKAFEEEVLFRPYSKLVRLVNAAEFTEHTEGFVKQLAGTWDSLRNDNIHDGFFCSEIVARYFEILGLDLFTDDRPAERVSPNHLNHDSCLLKEVPDAFVNYSQLQIDDVRISEINILTREEDVIPVGVKIKELDEKVNHAAKLLAEDAKNLRVSNQTTLEQMYEEMIESAIMAADLGQSARANKIKAHASTVFLLDHINQQIDKINRRMKGIDIPDEDVTAWNQAELQLIVNCNLLQLKTMRAYSRTMMLLALENNRNKLHNEATPWYARLLLKCRLHKLLYEYRKSRVTYQSSINESIKLQRADPLFSKSFEYINEVISKAVLAATQAVRQ